MVGAWPVRDSNSSADAVSVGRLTAKRAPVQTDALQQFSLIMISLSFVFYAFRLGDVREAYATI
jgi:hypothetical protein